MGSASARALTLMRSTSTVAVRFSFSIVLPRVAAALVLQIRARYSLRRIWKLILSALAAAAGLWVEDELRVGMELFRHREDVPMAWRNGTTVCLCA